MGIHDLSERRRSYERDALGDDVAVDPFQLFGTWLADAVAGQDSGASQQEATAFSLATVRHLPDGSLQPRNRTLLLKFWDPSGFVFFTNHDSDKGLELAAEPRAAMHWHWYELERQVRVQGTCERLETRVARRYFAQRPRGSQVGAWASRQSAPIASRARLEEQEAEAARRFADGEVPMPPFWGGYRLVPDRIEFWQGRPSRLHDRIVYTKVGGAAGDETAGPGWDRTRLQP